jgi:hypothetical protein
VEVDIYNRHFSTHDELMSAQQRYENDQFFADRARDPKLTREEWESMYCDGYSDYLRELGLATDGDDVTSEPINEFTDVLGPEFDISDDETDLNQDIEFVVIQDTQESSTAPPRSPLNMFDAFKGAATAPESPIKLTMELQYCYQYTCPKCKYGLHKVVYDGTEAYVPGELICLSC